MICVFVQIYLNARGITGGHLRQAASSEPSWQWTCPSQRCQSGMQRGGRWHRNWPKAQRPGTGGGGEAWVGTGASVTEPLTAVKQIKVFIGYVHSILFNIFLSYVPVWQLVILSYGSFCFFFKPSPDLTTIIINKNMHMKYRPLYLNPSRDRGVTCGTSELITAIRTVCIAITHPGVDYTSPRATVEAVGGTGSRTRGHSVRSNTIYKAGN